MQVSNGTKGVINYRGKTYGPNASFALADGDEKKRGIVGMLESGALKVGLSAGVDESTGKPSSGLTVDESTGKPSSGLTVDELKQALTARGVDIPDGAKKADLAGLLDAS